MNFDDYVSSCHHAAVRKMAHESGTYPMCQECLKQCNLVLPDAEEEAPLDGGPQVEEASEAAGNE